MIQKIKSWDNKIITIMSKDRNRHLNRTMIIFTKLGSSGLVWAIIAMLFLINKEYRPLSLEIFFCLALTGIMGEFILKRTIGRHRPSEGISSDDLLVKKPRSYSFPSGHTVSSFSSALVISLQFPLLAFPVFLLAAIISFSRIYLRVHYPSDVIAGSVIGLFFGLIVSIIIVN